MAEHDFREDGLSYVITPTDAMTGDRNRRMQLYYQLIQSISGAKQIDIIVSFLMESGVRMLLKDLKSALDRGVTVRILTGNYLGITQPSALYQKALRSHKALRPSFRKVPCCQRSSLSPALCPGRAGLCCLLSLSHSRPPEGTSCRSVP